MSILSGAAAMGDAVTVKKFIEENRNKSDFYKCLNNSYDSSYVYLKEAPLALAVQNRHPECIVLLLAAQAEMEYQYKDEINCLAMSHAVDKGFIDCVVALVEGGMSPDKIMQCAASYNKPDCLSFLLEQTVSPVSESFFEDLLCAAFLAFPPRQCVDIVLKAAEARLNQCDNWKRTVLSYAVRNNDNELMDKLLAAGADPNATIRSWKAPLCMAVDYGDRYAVRALIQAGANPDISFRYGKTVLEEAQKYYYYDMVEILCHDRIQYLLDREDYQSAMEWAFKIQTILKDSMPLWGLAEKLYASIGTKKIDLGLLYDCYAGISPDNRDLYAKSRSRMVELTILAESPDTHTLDGDEATSKLRTDRLRLAISGYTGDVPYVPGHAEDEFHTSKAKADALRIFADMQGNWKAKMPELLDRLDPAELLSTVAALLKENESLKQENASLKQIQTESKKRQREETRLSAPGDYSLFDNRAEKRAKSALSDSQTPPAKPVA